MSTAMPVKPPSRISVVIPVYNSATVLSKLLRALEMQDYPAQLIEILIVDDGSTDEPAKIAQRCKNARVLQQQNMGSYAARNFGIHQARGEIVAFTDADCIPRPDWIREGVLAMDRSTADIVVGKIEFMMSDRHSVVELYDMNFHLNQAYYSAYHQFGATANLLATRETFARHGPFDPARRSGGDFEFCRRAVKAGARLAYAPCATVLHPTRRTFRELLRKRLRVAEGLWKLPARPVHKLTYLLPRRLSNYPTALHQVDLSQSAVSIRARFILLHYGIEFMCCMMCLRLLLSDALQFVKLRSVKALAQ